MKKFTLFIIFIYLSIFSFSQSIISTAGDYFTTDKYSLSWTLGETVIESFYNDIILTQGFQQATLISNTQLDTPYLDENGNVIIDDYDVWLYPNPTKEYINIVIKSFSDVSSRIEMYDMIGNIIIDKTTDEYFEKIYLTNYSTNVFLLKITNLKTNNTRIYKILKSK